MSTGSTCMIDSPWITTRMHPTRAALAFSNIDSRPSPNCRLRVARATSLPPRSATAKAATRTQPLV